ncbi:MAG: methylenetetrahydrofolate reductase [NAD(P)H] [Mailhella sp.]|nr:methylenetetrahydrofolate reductase [NAD(P)H] [Mailhella sp.]
MKIIDIIKSEKPTLSFEVFPPKTFQSMESVRQATAEIAELGPDFMSVTYGVGGGTAAYTAEIAEHIQTVYGIPVLAHLTCVSAGREKIAGVLNDLKERGIENVLALRGDVPEGVDVNSLDFRHASDLVPVIRRHGDFCIGGACYPEKHPESVTFGEDLRNLKVKVESGCDFLTTQMFFDNNILYNFLYRMREAGIRVPVVAGVMPVTNAAQIRRIMAISGSVLPPRFIRIVERYGDDPQAMLQAGTVYATEQIIDLYANGLRAVHVYTMNKPEVARRILHDLSAIIR